MEDNIYRSKNQFISPSDIKGVNTLAVFHKKFYGEPGKPTPAMMLGTLFHLLILQPEKFAEIVAVYNKGNAAKTKEFKAANEDKLIIEQEDYDMLKAMEAGIMSYPGIETILRKENAVVETPLFCLFHFDEHGVVTLVQTVRHKDVDTIILADFVKQNILPVKTKPDLFYDDKPEGIELKTTQCAKPSIFQAEYINYGYHIQLTMMYDIINAHYGRTEMSWTVIASEKGTGDCACYNIPDNVIEYGRHVYQKRLFNVLNAFKDNRFPSYDYYSNYTADKPQIINLQLPGWVINKKDDNEF